MRVKIFGTGCLAAKDFSTCFSIDDYILIDCPNGLMKKLRQSDYDFGGLGVVIISHFHGDHDWDMPFLLREFIRGKKREKPLTLIAPAGVMDRYRTLFAMALPEDDFSPIYENAKLEVIEISPEVTREPLEINWYSIKIFKVLHGATESYGVQIKKSGETVGFTCDSVMCDGVRGILDGADLAFVDVTMPAAGKVHMGLGDLEILKAEFDKCRIFPVHMMDQTREVLKEHGHEIPNDGDEFEVK